MFVVLKANEPGELARATLVPDGDAGGTAVGSGRAGTLDRSLCRGLGRLVAPDDTTFAYLEGRPHAPKGTAWERALDDWRRLPTDPDAAFDKEVVIDGNTLRPCVSWGTNPSQVVTIDDEVP